MGRIPAFYSAYNKFHESEKNLATTALQYIKAQLLKQKDHSFSFGERKVPAKGGFIERVYLLCHKRSWVVYIQTTKSNALGLKDYAVDGSLFAFETFILAEQLYSALNGADDNETIFYD